MIKAVRVFIVIMIVITVVIVFRLLVEIKEASWAGRIIRTCP